LRCCDISADFRSPRGRRFRSPVLNTAMLYWQFTVTWGKSVFGVFVFDVFGANVYF
jgi:hypothetical protein